MLETLWLSLAKSAHIYTLCLVPLLVAMDPITAIPIYLGLTSGLAEVERRRIARNACLTALVIALLFLALGEAVFRILGIHMADFLVAGGILLFCFSVVDLLLPTQRRPGKPDETIGAVPLGTPLLVGPGTLAAALLLLGQFGFWPTAAAIAVCVAFAWLCFRVAGHLAIYISEPIFNAFGRIMSLLLAAYAVMMVRKGICAMAAAGIAP